MVYDVIIIGAGAAGLMCGMTAGAKGKSVLILDHAKKPAEKIRISGGGRCNFINIHQSPSAYLSDNSHFCKSALSRYTQNDFIDLVEKHDIAYHEKTLGQLFCDYSAKDIINMLLTECTKNGVKIQLETTINTVKYDVLYHISTNKGDFQAKNMVIATGGLSIPKMGATDFGYRIAKQFGLKLTPLSAALVPLTFENDLLAFCKNLSGLSVDAIVTTQKISFREGLLFTHRGLSGPSILQISPYWVPNTPIIVNLCPDLDIFVFLKAQKETSKQDITNILSQTPLPKRLSDTILEELNISGKIAEISDKKLQKISDRIHKWQIIPSGTEGYRTAEVTLGGVSTSELSSKTMESKKQKGLYFIGEVVDVTGHLGGFNFGWAWASGFVCGENIE